MGYSARPWPFLCPARRSSRRRRTSSSSTTRRNLSSCSCTTARTQRRLPTVCHARLARQFWSAPRCWTSTWPTLLHACAQKITSRVISEREGECSYWLREKKKNGHKKKKKKKKKKKS